MDEHPVIEQYFRQQRRAEFIGLIALWVLAASLFWLGDRWLFWFFTPVGYFFAALAAGYSAGLFATWFGIRSPSIRGAVTVAAWLVVMLVGLATLISRLLT